MQRPVSIWCEWYPWEVVTKQASSSRLPLANIDVWTIRRGRSFERWSPRDFNFLRKSQYSVGGRWRIVECSIEGSVFRGPASGNISRYGNAIRYRSVLYARAFSLSLSVPRSLASLSFDLRPDFPYFFVTGFIKIYRHGPRFAWIKRSIRELERDGKEVTGVTVNVPVNYNTKRSTVAIGLSCRRGFVFKRIHV